MQVPARRRRDEASDEVTAFDFAAFDAFAGLETGERICAPREREGSTLGAAVIIVLLLGVGWLATQGQSGVLADLGAKVADIAALVRADGPPGTSPPSYATVPSAAAEPNAAATPMAAEASVPPGGTAGIETAALPGDSAAASPAEPSADATVEIATVAPPAEEAAPGPLPPPRVDPADPYQKRAAAAGLHPELSRVLLTRLSDADYRNARYAVDTAIAKSADTAEFIWPRQRRPEQALFRVHFVAGAAASCRRYVVTVVKDGWSTTAPPMERCGAQAAAGKGA